MQHARPIGPITNAAAPDSVEMIQGVTAPKQRYFSPFHQGWTVSQTTHVVAPASVEMFQGSAPQKSRAFVFPKTGWSVAQTTPVAAPLSVEMTAGVTAPRWRYTAPFHQGTSWWTPEVEAFSIETIIGSRPERNRQRLAPKIPLPVSQTTHTDAPVSIEMFQGVTAPRRRMETTHRQRAGWMFQPDLGPALVFNPAWAQGSNRTVGMDIQPE